MNAALLLPASLFLGEIAIAFCAAVGLASLWLIVPNPYVPLAAIVGIGAFTLAIQRPFLACLAFLVFTYFRVHEAYPVLMPLRLPLLISILALISLGWHVTLAKSITPVFTREIQCFLVFFLLATVGIAFATNRAYAFEVWSESYWKVGVMTLALAWLARRQDFKLAGIVFVGSGIAIGAVALYNKHTGSNLVELTRVTIGRDIGSVLGDPNDLSLVLLFPFSFAMAGALYTPGLVRKTFAFAAMAVILAGIVATQSRGGLIGVLAIGLTFGLRVVRSKSLVIIGGLLIAVSLYGAMNISGRISGGSAKAGLDESSSERLDTWKAAVRMAAARPLNGVGMANAAGNFYFYTDQFRGHSLTVHSTWFAVLAETGFPGLAVFVAMIASCFRSVSRSIRRTHQQAEARDLHVSAIALLGALVGFCASGTFLNQVFNWPIYMLVALTAALSSVIDQPTHAPFSTSDVWSLRT